MFEEPDEQSAESALDPTARANEKVEELRMYAELAAVFEATRKFEAQILFDLDPEVARSMQQSLLRLEKAKIESTPVISPESNQSAIDLLKMPVAAQLSTNDYHVRRRPGEVLIARWIEAEQVNAFYERYQAHFDAAIEGQREDDRQALEWKNDPGTAAYLEALDKTDAKMAERYLRELIREHRVFVLSTTTADELDILYLAETLMGATPSELVGEASAPADNAPERDRAWYFRFFSLRGVVETVERMCFLAYLQKTEDTFDLD
jgi:hypothetical protein